MNPLDTNQESSPLIQKPLEPEEFRRQGYMVIDFLTEYFKNIEKYPVRSQVEPGYLRKRIPTSAPDNPEPMETILEDIKNDILPGLTHWQSPNFFSFFQCNNSPAGILGETLAAGFNVLAFSWISSPAATELECIVMDWLAEQLNLPKAFTFAGQGGGVMTGTTDEAILATIAAARDRVLEKIGQDNVHKLVVYGSDQTHSCFFKSAKIAGISPRNFRRVKTSRAHAFALQPEALRSAIEADLKAGLVPLFLCATVGTTSTTAIDPLAALCDVTKDYDNMWVHVDAAYAGSVCLCPEFRHMINGVESVDSFSFNAHKWFLTSLDCCCMWVKDPTNLIRSLSANPEYLKNKVSDTQQVVDYKDWQITLTRRFRALKLWIVLRSYGVEYLRNFFRSHIKMAIHFEKLISMDKRFEIVVPRRFSLVCFRLAPCVVTNHEENLNELNSKLLESINLAGDIQMTHTIVDGIFMIRCAIANSMTDIHHVTHAWKVIQDHASALLLEHKISICNGC